MPPGTARASSGSGTSTRRTATRPNRSSGTSSGSARTGGSARASTSRSTPTRSKYFFAEEAVRHAGAWKNAASPRSPTNGTFVRGDVHLRLRPSDRPRLPADPASNQSHWDLVDPDCVRMVRQMGLAAGRRRVRPHQSPSPPDRAGEQVYAAMAAMTVVGSGTYRPEASDPPFQARLVEVGPDLDDEVRPRASARSAAATRPAQTGIRPLPTSASAPGIGCRRRVEPRPGVLEQVKQLITTPAFR